MLSAFTSMSERLTSQLDIKVLPLGRAASRWIGWPKQLQHVIGKRTRSFRSFSRPSLFLVGRIIAFQWAVNPHLSRLQLGLTGRPSRLLRESQVGPPC